MKGLMTFLAGLVFGLGLIVSGMTNPAKVIGFLDITVKWDPSLAFVIVGAISLAYFAFRITADKKTTVFDDPIHLPGTSHITKELIIGSLIFGAGWALAGFCPGPALVALGTGRKEALIFSLAMLAGMLLHDHLYERSK